MTSFFFIATCEFCASPGVVEAQLLRRYCSDPPLIAAPPPPLCNIPIVEPDLPGDIKLKA